MRVLKILFVLSLLFGCNKVKKSPDYQRFIGTWISISSMEEKTIMTFSKNGKIEFESSGERGDYFRPNNYTTRKSSYETMGIPWDDYYFKKEQPFKETFGRVVIVNATSDTLLISKKQVSGFIVDSLFTILLVKK